MGEVFIESQPQIEIPNLNTWRWQAERIAIELIGPEPAGLGLAHRVARFFDDAPWMKAELTQKFKDEFYGLGPVPTPEDYDSDEDYFYECFLYFADRPILPFDEYDLKLLEYCEGNIIIEKSKPVFAAETGRILDLDRLRQQLSNVHLYTELGSSQYGMHEGVIKRSDHYKQVLLEVLELTRDGIVRTDSSREISQGLLRTMKLIDF
jgi:hypothetical protein